MSDSSRTISNILQFPGTAEPDYSDEPAFVQCTVCESIAFMIWEDGIVTCPGCDTTLDGLLVRNETE